jgi:hypothetical protein
MKRNFRKRTVSGPDRVRPSTVSVSDSALRNHLDALYRISAMAGGLDAGVRLNEAGDQVAEYLRRGLERAGAHRVRKQGFSVMRWWPEACRASVRTGGAEVRLSAFPLWYCSESGPEELELVDGGCGSRGELRGRDLRGKAVLVRMRRIFHFIPTFEKLGTLPTLAQRGAAAVVVMDDLLDTPSGMLAVTHRQVMARRGRQLPLYPLPAVSIGRAEGRSLIDRLASGPVVLRLHLRISVREARACNVIAEIPGNGRSREVVLVGGHYDTWFGGALDNLASQAGILEMVRHFAAVPLEHRPRSLMFACIFGHEFGNQGHAALAEELGPIRDRITCFVDVDGSGSTGWEVDAGGRIVETGLNDVCGIVASSNALARLATEALYDQDVFSFRLPNHMQIADLDGPLTELGIPTLLVIGKHLFYHSPLDTPDRIPAGILRRRMAVNLRILSTLLASPDGYYIATNRNPHRSRFPAVPHRADLDPDDLPVNPRPWTDGPPRDLCFEVFPSRPRIFSPVIVWRGHAVGEGINRGEDIRWRFGSFIGRVNRKLRRGGASGTVYMIPGTKEIRMTVTDRHGRSSFVTRKVRVTW